MKIDAKTIIAVLAALLSAWAQYKAENVSTAQAWTQHRIEATQKGRRARFAELEQRLAELEALVRR